MSLLNQLALCAGIGFAIFLGVIVWFLFRCWLAEQDSVARCAGEDKDIVSYTYDNIGEYSRAHDEMLANGWRLLHVTPRAPGQKTFTATFRRVK